MRIVQLCLLASFTISSSVFASEPFECLIEPHQLVDVSSSELGVLASVQVEQADAVKKGDVLAKLRAEVELVDFQVSRARADAKADLELLRQDLEFNTRKRDRISQLEGSLAVAAQDVDQVNTLEDASRLRLQAASEKQKTALLEAVRDELALARRTVRSPLDGVVVHRYKHPGEYVDADPIVQLAQLDPLRIEVVLPIAMFGKVHTGMQATVIPEMPIDGPFLASVESVDPMMDAATATFGVRLSLPNPEHRLPPGLKCSLAFQSFNASAEELTVAAPVASAEIIEELNTTETDAHSAVKHPLDVTPVQLNTPPPVVPGLGAALETVSEEYEQTQNSLTVTDNQSATRLPETATGELDCESHLVSAGVAGKAGDSVISQQADSLTSESAAMEHAVGPWTVLSHPSAGDPGQLLKNVQKTGVKDLQWFKSGRWKDRLSFGRYANRQNAENRLKRIESLGFDVVMIASKIVKMPSATAPGTSSTTSESADTASDAGSVSHSITGNQSNCIQQSGD